MIVRWVAAAAATLALAAPSAAAAQTSVSLTLVSGALVTQQSIPVRINGALAVRFHGDPAASCGAHGTCGDSGSVVWAPAGGASIDVFRTRAGRLTYQLDLLPGGPGGPGAPSSTTSAQVQRSAGAGAPGECVDTTSFGGSSPLSVRAGRVSFDLADAVPALVATRCAGPRAAAVLSGIPVPRLSTAAVRRGHVTVSLTGSGAFSADGFAGTTVSTLVLRIGQPGRMTKLNSGSGPPVKPRRALIATYRVTVSGSVVEHVAGDPTGGACALLDSCGVTGTVTLAPVVRHGTAVITALQALTRPVADLRSAFGLAGTGRGSGSARGLTAFGSASWSPGGTLTAALGPAGATCTDSAPLGPGAVSLGAARGHFGAVYFDAGEGSSGPALAGGCPGPFNTGGEIAESSPMSAALLRDRRIVLPIRKGIGWLDDGYTVRPVADLTLTLTRVRTRLAVERIP